MFTVILGSIFLLLPFLYLYLVWNFDYWKRRGMAGPSPSVYIGTFPKTALFYKDSNYMSECDEIHRKYFRKHRFVGVFEYRTPKLMILDPTLVADVYVKYFKNFSDNTFSETIKLMYPIMEKVGQRMAMFIKGNIESGNNVFNTAEIAKQYIGGVVYNVIFGLDANIFNEKSDFLETSGRMFKPPNVIHSVLLKIFPIFKTILPTRFLTTEFTDWFTTLFLYAVSLRKKSNIQRDDYLSYLINLKERKNTPTIDLVAHTFTFYLDGFQTSSSVLERIITELAKDTECQAKLRAEIKSYNRIGFEELLQMPYLDAIFKETTRIRADPFPSPIWKTCTEDIELTDYDGKTYRIEKGMGIILPVTSLHKHPDYYVDPHIFRPERFSENTDAAKRLQDAGVFLPFGDGPRVCLGKRFALAQIKAAICALINDRADPLFWRNPFIDRGMQWKKRRAEVSPAFSMQKTKPMYTIMENVGHRMTKFIDENIESGKSTLGSKDIATRYIAEVVCNAMYGLDANAFERKSDFLENSRRMLNTDLSNAIHSILLEIFPIFRGIFPTRFVSKGFTDWFTNLFLYAVKLRTESKIQRDDFLNFLIDLEERKHPPTIELVAHAFTFFLDGFETSSYILGNAINELAKNKECQIKLRKEINSYGRIGFDELNQMPYLDAVFNETTRIIPFPFPIMKTCTEDIEFTDFDGSTVRIEKGISVILPVTALHKHPDYYADPESFDPERFNVANGGAKTLRDAGVFMPFGYGPRICLGMRFATAQIKSAIFALVKDFDFSLKPAKQNVSGSSSSFFFSDNTAEIIFNRLQ